MHTLDWESQKRNKVRSVKKERERERSKIPLDAMGTKGKVRMRENMVEANSERIWPCWIPTPQRRLCS